MLSAQPQGWQGDGEGPCSGAESVMAPEPCPYWDTPPLTPSTWSDGHTPALRECGQSRCDRARRSQSPRLVCILATHDLLPVSRLAPRSRRGVPCRHGQERSCATPPELGPVAKAARSGSFVREESTVSANASGGPGGSQVEPVFSLLGDRGLDNNGRERSGGGFVPASASPLGSRAEENQQTGKGPFFSNSVFHLKDAGAGRLVSPLYRFPKDKAEKLISITTVDREGCSFFQRIINPQEPRKYIAWEETFLLLNLPPFLQALPWSAVPLRGANPTEGRSRDPGWQWVPGLCQGDLPALSVCPGRLFSGDVLGG